MKTAMDYFDDATKADFSAEDIPGLREGIRLYGKALELEPDFPEAYFNRAGNWEQLGEYTKAIADYEQVLVYWPEDFASHGCLASIYLHADEKRVRNRKLSLYHAKRACELGQFSNFGDVSMLGAAYFANEQYSQAVSFLEKAIAVASEHFEADLWVPGLEERLLKYRQKKQQSEQRGIKRWLNWLYEVFSRRDDAESP